jgi:hypothetical protein
MMACTDIHAAAVLTSKSSSAGNIIAARDQFAIRVTSVVACTISMPFTPRMYSLFATTGPMPPVPLNGQSPRQHAA